MMFGLGINNPFNLTEKEEIVEYTDKEVKMAVGIAADPRYKGGNMTGAVKAIEKIRRGLSKHKKVAAVLQRVNEELELDEMREPFVVIDTADGNKVVAMASDEKGAKSSIASAQLPPMSIKDKKTLKIVKVKKKQMIGQPIKEGRTREEVDGADPKKQSEYQKFFAKELKKRGVKSPSELSAADKKAFFDYIDKNWEGDNESD